MSNWMPKRHASSNMRDYLKNATLPKMPLAPSTPPMPPQKHKSHRNTLTVRPERYRKLHQIHLLTNSHFKDDVLTFMNKYVPAGSLGIPDVDPDTGERIAIPCPGYSIAWLQPPPLRHVEELGTVWIEQNVLRSAQRIIQMLPAFTDESTHWTMERPEVPDNDHSIFRHFAWTKSQDADSGLDPCDPTCSLVLSYQPPWVLSPQDFKQVTNLRAFPLIDLHKKNQRLNSAERVWGKLWDTCKQKNCRWFILTSYSQWAFGRFSRGWTRGFISEIFDINSKGPTTLQCVLYWMASSMEMPGVEGHRIAEVGSEPEYEHRELPCVVYDVMCKDPRAAFLLSLLAL
ncbi:hypothetical protein BD410DRAFT_421136 [Rickenella mellea]|uniref:Uncharacterized protein n=1 Tax=Rickenella mellea TaxID=50990 RepID=A0A4Y7QJQ5_9AGAM|nr:hypothetical protein BD410DRAFT_421136 [Rickenella mellea]